MSHVTSSQIHGRVLRFQDSNGEYGLGEIVFSPALPEPDRKLRIEDEHSYLAALIGKPFDFLTKYAATVARRDKSWRGIAFALETAWLDWRGKQTGQSVSQLLGDTVQTGVPDYFSISESGIPGIQSRIEKAGNAYRVFQLKLGIGSLNRDIEQLLAILDVLDPGQTIQADANGGWTVDEACDIIDQIEDERIIWEEPCKTYDENVAVARHTSHHVMVDQCIGEPNMAIKAIDDGIAQSICIKPAPLGGLLVARKIRDHATAAGMRVRIDGPWCGDIASAVILHLAVGMPRELLISGCDLREPVATPFNLNGARRLQGNLIAPPPGIGLGLEFPEPLAGPAEKTLKIGGTF